MPTILAIQVTGQESWQNIGKDIQNNMSPIQPYKQPLETELYLRNHVPFAGIRNLEHIMKITSNRWG